MYALQQQQARSQLLARGENTRVARGRRACTPPLAALASNPRTAKLRELLAGPNILKGPCCHDGLSARLIERAGFDFAFMSGFCTAGARLGAPDAGLISYAEMVDTGRNVHEATRAMPIIGDGDTGYGNALNVKRTVRGYAAAGFAGILIEDQLWPKSCGHVKGKRVAQRDEAVGRIRAAADARDEGADILILARSDARQAESLAEALWRAAAFADAGADLLFIDALASEDEMAALCSLGGAAAALPKMANMLEGGGKTPILPPEALQALGFKLVAYPLSLLGVSIRAMEGALAGLKQGQLPGAEALGSFADIQAAVGFPEYYKEEERYAVVLPQVPPPSTQQQQQQPRSTPATPPATPASAAASPAGGASPGSSSPPPGASGFGAAAAAAAAAASPAAAASVSGEVVEADEVVPPPSSSLQQAPQQQPGQQQGGYPLSMSDDAARRARWDAFRRSRFFKVTIRDTRSGLVKLETRIPAGFIGGLTALVPQVAGVDFEALLEGAMGGRLEPGQPLFSAESGNDAITVCLEE